MLAVAFVAAKLATRRIDQKTEVALRAVEAEDNPAPVARYTNIDLDHHIGADWRGAEGPDVAEAGVGLDAIGGIAGANAPAIAAGYRPVAVGVEVGLVDNRPTGYDRRG